MGNFFVKIRKPVATATEGISESLTLERPPAQTNKPTSREPVTCIQDLPIEMHLEILEKLSLHELVVNSSKTCHQWRDDIAQHILAPKILALAKVNEKFKMDIKEKGFRVDII